MSIDKDKVLANSAVGVVTAIILSGLAWGWTNLTEGSIVRNVLGYEPIVTKTQFPLHTVTNDREERLPLGNHDFCYLTHVRHHLPSTLTKPPICEIKTEGDENEEYFLVGRQTMCAAECVDIE